MKRSSQAEATSQCSGKLQVDTDANMEIDIDIDTDANTDTDIDIGIDIEKDTDRYSYRELRMEISEKGRLWKGTTVDSASPDSIPHKPP